MAENPVVADALEAESDFLGAGGDVGLRGDKINRYGGNGPGNQATFTMGYSSLHCRVYDAMRQSLLDVGGWSLSGERRFSSQRGGLFPKISGSRDSWLICNLFRVKALR